MVVNKSAGLLVQGDQTGDESLVDIAKRYIKNKYNKPGDVFLGLVHRLDRPTTGVIVLVRTSKALTRLNQQFKDRIPKKVYRAIVSGTPESSARLEHYLKKTALRISLFITQKLPQIQNTQSSAIAMWSH